jgi:hypothetical protein
MISNVTEIGGAGDWPGSITSRDFPTHKELLATVSGPCKHYSLIKSATNFPINQFPEKNGLHT